MESLNKINEACPGVTRIMIGLFLKQWIENEENLLIRKRSSYIWGARNSNHITFSLPHPGVAICIL